MTIDFHLYQQYLLEYLRLAICESDGSNRGIYERLSEIQVHGRFVRHRSEKQRALEDAQRAFDEHRHWPREIVLKQLGIDLSDI